MQKNKIIIAVMLIVISVGLSSCNNDLDRKNSYEANKTSQNGISNTDNQSDKKDEEIEINQEENTEVYEDYLNPRNAMDLVRETYYSDVPLEDVDFSFHDYIKHIESDEIWYMIQVYNNSSDSAGVATVAVHPLTGHILSLEEHFEEFILD